MIITTTNSIDGKKITEYHGIVTGETILGANVFSDILASITDIVGGRSGTYEKKLKEAREIAQQEMSQSASELGCNAVIGVDIDYEVIGKGGSNMLMVTMAGTAVKLS